MGDRKRNLVFSPRYILIPIIMTMVSVVLIEHYFDTRMAPIIIMRSDKMNVTINKRLGITDTSNSINVLRKLNNIDSFATRKVFELEVNTTRRPPLKGVLNERNKKLRKTDSDHSFRIVMYKPNYRRFKTDPIRVNMSQCIYKNCITSVSKDTRGADAVIIQGSRPRLPLPVRERQSQMFIFASMETPLYLNFINLRDPLWDRYYNWTMTYRLDSDIQYMYGYIAPKHVEMANVLNELQTSDDLVGEKKKYADFEKDVYEHASGIENKNYEMIYRRKNITAAWMVTHCKTGSKREKFVNIMKEIIDIDIYGKCNQRMCLRNDDNCDKMIIQGTKFYLAFENTFCNDYITEKVFKWFEKDIIIVVRGGRTYKTHLPEGTYVNAEDFTSARELAIFLKELGSNETEYIKYLKRKDMYRVVSPENMTMVAYCSLCRKLNDVNKYGKQFNMRTSWADNSCIATKEVVVT